MKRIYVAVSCLFVAVIGILPLIAMGDDASDKSLLSSPSTNNNITKLVPKTLRLNVTCRSGAVVMLDNAALVEQGIQQQGAVAESTAATTSPGVRLQMIGGGTVTIPWDEIDKIAVGEKGNWGESYPIEITLKNVKEPKVGMAYGHDTTLVGQSDVGEFSIQLKDVTEIIVLPSV